MMVKRGLHVKSKTYSGPEYDDDSTIFASLDGANLVGDHCKYGCGTVFGDFSLLLSKPPETTVRTLLESL
jgi:hypothetical protein